MNMACHRVIVPVNFYPPNNRSVAVAEQLATQFECDMELASMLYDPSHTEDRQRLLKRMARDIKDHVVHTTLKGGTDPAPFILDLINCADSLVVLAGGTTLVGIPGSITSDVLRFASRPTVIVGPDVDPHWHAPVKHLMVPLDSSRAAEAALTTAAQWAAACGATLDLVQVVSPGNLEASEYLEQVATSLKCAPRARVSWDVLHSSALHRASEICDRADQQPGTIICMASHGSRHSQSMIASTTLRVIHHSAVPVLVTRS